MKFTFLKTNMAQGNLHIVPPPAQFDRLLTKAQQYGDVLDIKFGIQPLEIIIRLRGNRPNDVTLNLLTRLVHRDLEISESTPIRYRYNCT